MPDKELHVLILAGGPPVDPAREGPLPRVDMVIAADSGLEQAERLGLVVDLLVGDLDSVSAGALRRAGDVATEQHPPDKDATDLDLALHAARTRDAARVTIVGGHGGRLDHYLANALLISSTEFAELDITWRIEGSTVTVIRGETRLEGQPGDTLTLLAIGGTASGITTEGLRWPLTGAELPTGSSRGVSNVLVEHVARITVRNGTLLAIQPAPE